MDVHDFLTYLSEHRATRWLADQLADIVSVTTPVPVLVPARAEHRDGVR